MDFFQPATDATCALPPRKSGAAVGGSHARKTRRVRKITATRRRARRNMAGSGKKYRQMTRRAVPKSKTIQRRRK